MLHFSPAFQCCLPPRNTWTFFFLLHPTSATRMHTTCDSGWVTQSRGQKNPPPYFGFCSPKQPLVAPSTVTEPTVCVHGRVVYLYNKGLQVTGAAQSHDAAWVTALLPTWADIRWHSQHIQLVKCLSKQQQSAMFVLLESWKIRRRRLMWTLLSVLA